MFLTIFLIFPNQKLHAALLPRLCTSGALLSTHPEEAESHGEILIGVVLPPPSWGFPSNGGVCGALTQAGINLRSKLLLHLSICRDVVWLDSTVFREHGYEFGSPSNGEICFGLLRF